MPNDVPRNGLEGALRVGGGTCAYSVWEAPGHVGAGPDVVLLHGAAANRHWWSHIVPMLGASRVLALDLWGHGDSSRRPAYTLDGWASQVVEMVRAWCSRPPYLVGHSVGGLIAVHAAQTAPDSVAAVLALDTVLRRTDERVLLSRRRTSERPTRTYPSLEVAVGEFVRRHPAAAYVDQGLLVEVGIRSHQRVAGGWQRAFDPRVFGRPEVSDDFLRAARVPTRWIRARRGNIDDPMAAQITSRLAAGGELLEVAGVGHQLTLEEPRLCASLIDDFRDWADLQLVEESLAVG